MKNAWSVGLASFVLASSSAAQATVWTVDDDGGADFLDLQPAVDAAADGDVILVKAGFYTCMSIIGKSLTVQADPPGAASITGPFFAPGSAIGIAAVSAEQSVVVRGLDAFHFGFQDTEITANVSGCDGPVLFEDCAITSGSGHVVVVDSCASVTFNRCTLDAGGSFYNTLLEAYLDRHALQSFVSNVYLYDSTLAGSRGPDATRGLVPLPPGVGGNAARLIGGTLFASGSTLTGGNGGSGIAGNCQPGFDGADAVFAVTDSLLRLLDTELQGGPGGDGSCGLPDGTDGLALAGPVTVDSLAGTARSLAVASPVRELGDLIFDYAGTPGDVVFLLVSADPLPGVYLPGPEAVLHLSLPVSIYPQGVVPGDGMLQQVFRLPDLGAGVATSKFFNQALFFASAGGVFHSGPSTNVLLDGSF